MDIIIFRMVNETQCWKLVKSLLIFWKCTRFIYGSFTWNIPTFSLYSFLISHSSGFNYTLVKDFYEESFCEYWEGVNNNNNGLVIFWKIVLLVTNVGTNTGVSYPHVQLFPKNCCLHVSCKKVDRRIKKH